MSYDESEANLIMLPYLLSVKFDDKYHMYQICISDGFFHFMKGLSPLPSVRASLLEAFLERSHDNFVWGGIHVD